MVSSRYLEILQRAEEGGRLSFEDLLFLLSAGQEEELEILFSTADRVRRKFVGDEIHLRGIIEFSNLCIQNCWYCGLRRDNRQLARYRMTPAEIVETAQKAKSRGLKTLVLQSGEDPWFTRERMSRLIREIKDSTGLAMTLSMGERPGADYREWKREGADRYLLKQETSSPALFVIRSSTAEHGAPLGHVGKPGNRSGHGCSQGADQDIPVTDVRELVRDHSHQFFLGENPHDPRGHSHGGMFRVSARGKGIGRIVLHDIDLRHG